MSSWFDDLQNFGSGLLDDVGEGMGNLIDSATAPSDQTSNPNRYQQPGQTVSDQNGNAVTKPQGEAVAAPTISWPMVGGIGVAVLLSVTVLALLLRGE